MFSNSSPAAAGSLITACAAAGHSTTLAHLPNTGINAIKVDSAGNIYLAGFQGVAGSSSDYAVAPDIDSAGAAYIYGTTSSVDFPVTAGALQSWPKLTRRER